MPDKQTPDSVGDPEEYRPVLDPDIAAGTNREPKVEKSSKPAAPEVAVPAPVAEPAKEVLYVKKEPNAIGRWFLRNLFSIILTILAAILVVSSLGMPTAFSSKGAGWIDLKYILFDVSGQTWVFLTIMFVTGFLAGVFFLRRRKVRNKKAK